MKKIITIAGIILILVVTSRNTYGREDEPAIVITSMINGNKTQGAVYKETALGDIVADAMAYAGGTQIAIANGGDLNGVLEAGGATFDDVIAVFTEDKQLATANISAENVWDLLEYGVSKVTIGDDEKTDEIKSSFDGFPQVSGIQTHKISDS